MINLPLDRTTAEFLLDLLEQGDPKRDGWRFILADDIREMLGMVSRKDEKSGQ